MGRPPLLPTAVIISSREYAGHGIRGCIPVVCISNEVVKVNRLHPHTDTNIVRCIYTGKINIQAIILQNNMEHDEWFESMRPNNLLSPIRSMMSATHVAMLGLFNHAGAL